MTQADHHRIAPLRPPIRPALPQLGLWAMPLAPGSAHPAGADAERDHHHRSPDRHRPRPQEAHGAVPAGPALRSSGGQDIGCAEVGRSSLLRAGLAVPRRQRSLVRRWLLVGIIGAALVALVLAVQWRALPLTGPTRLVYLLHDSIWLPLWGHLVTSTFPSSLIWLVILAGVLLLVAVEVLTPLPPLRALQVRVLARMARSRTGAALLVASDRMLARIGSRARMARIVALTGFESSRDAALMAPAMTPQAAAELAHLAGLALRLGDGEEAELTGMAEVLLLLLAPLPDCRDLAATLRMAILRQAVDKGRWTALLETAAFPGDARTDPRRLADLAADPVAAAMATLRLTQLVLSGRPPEALLWFEIWARLAMDPAPAIRDGLARAAGMIHFDHWSAKAEAAVHTGHPARLDGLLEQTLPGATGVPPIGEVFAASGELP